MRTNGARGFGCWWREFLTGLALAVMTMATAGEPPGSPVQDGKVDVGGRMLQFSLVGEGSPTVVIETGLGEPGFDSGSWKAVVEALSRSNRVLRYSRAGLGGSDAPSKRPRTVQDMSSDLHALLERSGTPGPYVLVGHSVGGLVARAFAAQYPGRLAGVVLVDASHPDQWSRWMDSLPPEMADEPEPIRNARKFLAKTLADPTSNPDHLDLLESGKQIRAARGMDTLPLIIVTHSPQWRMVPDLPDNVSAQLERDWQDMQANLLGLSGRSRQMVSRKAGHYVQAEDPDLVIDAIRLAIRESAGLGAATKTGPSKP